MSTIREDFEALMPKPDIRVDAFGDITATDRRFFVVGDFYTAEQVREAMKAVAERCAVLCDGLGEDAYSCADMDRTGNVLSMAESADACAAAIRAQTGGEQT
jgi:hypothetical protein